MKTVQFMCIGVEEEKEKKCQKEHIVVCILETRATPQQPKSTHVCNIIIYFAQSVYPSNTVRTLCTVVCRPRYSECGRFY